MLKKIVTVLIVIIMLFTPLSIFAETKEELEKKKIEAEKEKKEVQNEKSAILDEIEELLSSIEDNESKLIDINAQLGKLNREIEILKQDLEEAQKKYNEKEELLKEKLILGYEMGPTTYLDVLLNSNGILDFLSNYYFISEILQNDNDLLDSIEQQKQQIEKSKEELEEKQKKVKSQKIEQEKINVILANQKNKKQNKVSQLSEEEKQITIKIEEYNAEIRRVEQEVINAAQKANGQYNITISGTGILKWPLPYKARITSSFGNREAPVPGATTNHNGIDIGVPIGTAVYSAADGYVILTGSSSARGKYVMVKHANNLYTFYQHLDSIAVSAGTNVKQGQTIAYSGNTGIGSGPHLHFEVRTSESASSAVNPLNYL